MRWLNALLVVFSALGAGCEAARPVEHAPIQQAILCYVGPNMRLPMEELARRYTQQTGINIRVESAEVRALMDKIKESPQADIFVTHDPFLAMLAARGTPVDQAWAVASLKPMIAVPKGNPKKILGLEDLARPGLRVGLTDQANSLSGQIVSLMLRKAGIAAAVEANITRRTLVGREIADALLAGEIDACIVWNVVIFARRDRIEAVDIRPEWRPTYGVDAVVHSPLMGRLELDYVRVTLATLGTSRKLDDARAFARFVASPPGLAVFAANGFLPPDPDRPALPSP